MKSSLIALFVCISIITKAQTDSVTTKEPAWWGDGNNTFSLNIKVLQSYFIRPHTVKQFEKTLAHYERRWYNSDTIRYTDGSVKIVMPYINMRGDKMEELFLTYDADQKINAIRFILEEDQVRVDKLGNFMQKLKAAGYKENIAYARINRMFGNDRGIFLRHPTVKSSVSIYTINEYQSGIEFTK